MAVAGVGTVVTEMGQRKPFLRNESLNDMDCACVCVHQVVACVERSCCWLVRRSVWLKSDGRVCSNFEERERRCRDVRIQSARSCNLCKCTL